MRLLLDTCTFLWLATDDSQLTDHHNDPFDRGLVSQAILNGLTIVTPDVQIASYPAPVIW